MKRSTKIYIYILFVILFVLIIFNLFILFKNLKKYEVKSYSNDTNSYYSTFNS